MVRCKFKVNQKTEDNDGNAQIVMQPVYTGSKENEEFFKYTPSGSFQFGTVNKAAADQLEVGKEYYIDITPAE